MAKQSINTLKNWFKKGLKPLETQFADWLDSYWHKDTSIPIDSITGLQDTLNDLAAMSFPGLADGSGTTANGNAMDLGGVLTQNFLLDAAGFDILFSSGDVIQFIADNGTDLNVFTLSDADMSFVREDAVGAGFGLNVGFGGYSTRLFANDGAGLESELVLGSDGYIEMLSGSDMYFEAQGSFDVRTYGGGSGIDWRIHDDGAFQIIVSTTSSTLSAVDRIGRMAINSGGVGLYAQNAYDISVGHLAGVLFHSNDTDAYFSDLRAVPKGMEYEMDYSANFTDRSLPDTSWVKKRVTARYTADHTLALSDWRKIVEMDLAGANNLTVPLNATVALPVGYWIDGSQYGAGQTTIAAEVGVTIRTAGNRLKSTTQYSGWTLVKIAPDEWYLFGDLTV